ncbi:hypothetical protein WDU94_003516 [Cyamophila willieti]
MTLKNSAAPGYDGISSITLKKIVGYITKPLKHVINLSLDNGIFPTCYKKSIVIPVFKKGNSRLLENYRPISVLCNFSKILEKCIKSRLDFYLDNNNLITSRQFGFRKEVGCEDALLDITSYLHDKIDLNKKNLVVFLDLRKAYDSIKHTILLDQLQKLGLCDKTLDWFDSYLRDRLQQIRLDDYTTDSLLQGHFSIPQGTVLGPCLFNIYINELPGISKGRVLCYADDTVICYSGDDWDSVHLTATQDLTTVTNWYSNMSLLINFEKTNYMTLSITKTGQPTNSVLALHDPHTNTNVRLTRKTSVRYLGIIIDQHLKWTEHVKNLRQKIRSLMYIFANLRRICNIQNLRQLYFGLTHSLIQYCQVAWGGAYNNVTEPLQRSLNILIRIILKKDKYFDSNQLYKLFNVPTLLDSYTYKLTFFSIKYSNTWTLTRHNYHTRQTGLTATRQIHKSLTTRHFIYLGQKVINHIPENVKNLPKLSIIKLAVKHWLKEPVNERTIKQYL